ncbi:hypothetical protein GCM10027346_42010 [Hymenobacter seoulensis]
MQLHHGRLGVGSRQGAGTCFFVEMPPDGGDEIESGGQQHGKRCALAGLVAHSDQGSQDTATRFKNLLVRHRAVQSMSRRGNCYDNAHAELFWSPFKAELLDGGSFLGLAEAKLEISHHIAYYNTERRHSALGYLAPNHFETHLRTTSQFRPA